MQCWEFGKNLWNFGSDIWSFSGIFRSPEGTLVASLECFGFLDSTRMLIIFTGIHANPTAIFANLESLQIRLESMQIRLDAL